MTVLAAVDRRVELALDAVLSQPLDLAPLGLAVRSTPVEELASDWSGDIRENTTHMPPDSRLKQVANLAD